MGRILVLGSDTRSFLGVVRSLGRAGHEVHVAWCPPGAAAGRSRYVAVRHAIPAFDTLALARLMADSRFDLTIPCDDFTLLPLERARECVEAAGPVFLPNQRAFEICSDKVQTHALAAHLGIPQPRQRIARTAAEVEEAASEFGWPLILKPVASVTAEDPARHGARRLRSAAELRHVAEGMLAGGDIVVQEHFPGRSVGVEVLCHQGAVLFAFQHERIHEPVWGGGSSYRRSVAVSPDLKAAAEQLVGALAYTGVARVEFKVNPSTGAWVLMEINGRFWGALPLALAAGADLPRYLYEMLVEGRRDFPPEYATDVYARNWMLDLRWMARNLLARRDASPLTESIGQMLWEFRHLSRESSDTLTRDDPRPALAEVKGAIMQALHPLAHLLPPVRLRMAWRAARAVRRAGRVLLVSKGNICRGPFAEQYLRGLDLAGLAVDSAGDYPLAGRCVPDAALGAAGVYQVDLAGHRSRVLSEAQIRRADLVFVFGRDSEEAVLRISPEAADKIHYLGALSGHWSVELPDPWYHAAAFDWVYRRIQTALDRVAALRHAQEGWQAQRPWRPA